jgi:hypothetical protein
MPYSINVPAGLNLSIIAEFGDLTVRRNEPNALVQPIEGNVNIPGDASDSYDFGEYPEARNYVVNGNGGFIFNILPSNGRWGVVRA